jgi:pimeloyl-ACP methyl ester carboxylesterase
MNFEDAPGRHPPVVLLHHGAASLHAWDAWVPEIGGGRRIIAYDRRGFGDSARDAVFDALLFHRDADDLASLLRELQAAPAHLVGHSDGATVALLTAARHPDLVASATWIAGHTFLDEPLRQVVLRYPPDDPASPQGDWFRLWTEALAGWNIEDELRAVAAPTLVVHDRADPLSPPAQAESVARAIPHATVSWYETSNHWPHRRERERFLSELERHLATAET